MSKVIEELDNLVYGGQENPIIISFDITKFFQVIREVKNELQRLEAIDNANPSEALECLKHIKKYYIPEPCSAKTYDCLETIKQALLKAQENARSEEILQKYYQEGITLDSVRELEKENELLKEIIKSLFDRGCPLHQYTDKDFGLTIEVDDECSIMHLGEYKGIDLDKKLQEVLEDE